jgi:hypothetical protein
MKNKIVLISIIAILLLIGGIIIFGGSNKTGSTDTQATTNVPQSSAPMSVMPADKIEVVHFHGTQQCWSCITVGEYALKTIKEKFPEEFASGKIVYKDINGELKENQEIVVEYQARGSSLFVNAIRNEQDNIEEDVTVWRLVNNENQFVSYFENKLNTLLGK